MADGNALDGGLCPEPRPDPIRLWVVGEAPSKQPRKGFARYCLILSLALRSVACRDMAADLFRLNYLDSTHVPGEAEHPEVGREW